jgi:hypothetical protein
MSSECNDPNLILITPECKTTDVDSYNHFINQMNLYCSKDDNVISNIHCIDYINNNKFIQTTDFNKAFKSSAIDLCLNNLKDSNNKNCIDLYKTKPLQLIKEEEIQQAKANEDFLAKEAKKAKILYMWIIIGAFILILISATIYIRIKRRNNNEKYKKHGKNENDEKLMKRLYNYIKINQFFEKI